MHGANLFPRRVASCSDRWLAGRTEWALVMGAIAPVGPASNATVPRHLTAESTCCCASSLTRRATPRNGGGEQTDYGCHDPARTAVGMRGATPPAADHSTARRRSVCATSANGKRLTGGTPDPHHACHTRPGQDLDRFFFDRWGQAVVPAAAPPVAGEARRRGMPRYSVARHYGDYLTASVAKCSRSSSAQLTLAAFGRSSA